jgi:excinuclease UvrABC nuclease subunit
LSFHPTGGKLKNTFDPEEWRTPNSYGPDFKPLPYGPGLYLFASRDILPNRVEYKPLYVGMSKSIAKRCSNHPVKRTLEALVDVVTFFVTVPECDLRSAEKLVIVNFKPPYNISLKGWL